MTTRASAIVEVAGLVQRLAVLLSAGVPPASAWRYVAESSTSPVPGLVVAGIADASRVDEAIAASLDALDSREATAWRGLAAAWSVATDAGSPLAPALREFASTLRDVAQVDRDITVALAGPLATSRIVLVLPAVGVLFGAALGFDTIGTLFTTPVGLACLAAGVVLLFAARRWTKHLVASAQPGELTAGLHAELIAIAVSGGGALDSALDTSARALARFGIEHGSEADAAVELSRRAGVPAAELLRSEAVEARRNARARAELAAASLAVKLMLPLGLCILPAFIALGVVPMLIAVISSTVATF